MNPEQFFEQIAQGEYEAFRKYLNTGENGGPLTNLSLFVTLQGMRNQSLFLEHLFEALKPITTLTTLKLDLNNIDNAGAVAIAQALKTNTTLTTLNLAANIIGDAGAVAIAQALKTNTTLTTLNLGDNDIGLDGTDGANAIAEALKTNTSLTALYLQGNKIDSDGATALALALKTNATLTTLNLNRNRIDTAGAAAVLSQIPLGSALMDFRISDSIAQGNTNVIIRTLQTEKKVLDEVYQLWPQPITEAFAQYFTEIKTEADQNLLIVPNNDINRGLAYVKHRRLARPAAQEAPPNASLASNDDSHNTQDAALTATSGKRNKKQDNSAKRLRRNPKNK